MNKEEILAKSRQENKEKDLVAIETGLKADRFGMWMGIIANAILFITEIIICGTYNLGLWVILLAMNAGIYLYNGIKLKRKGIIIAGVIWAVLAVAFIGTAISNLFTTSTIL